MLASSVTALRPFRWISQFAIIVALLGLLAIPHSAQTLASTSATLVKDINTIFPSASGSVLDQAVSIGATTYFTAGTENFTGYPLVGLWKTSGTVESTSLVVNVLPQHLTVYNQAIFFATGRELEPTFLWKTNGTGAGTSAFYGFDNSVRGISDMVSTPDGLFFLTSGNSSYGLWRSDGTAAGTVRLRQFDSTIGSFGFPSSLVAIGNTLFFRAYDADAGWELWRSDGTDAGTTRVKDIRAGTDGSYPNGLTVVGTNLLFFASTASGDALWKSDGTEAGTIQIKEDVYQRNELQPQLVTVAGNAYFVVRGTDETGYSLLQLWKSDGTSVGTSKVATLPTVNSISQDPISQFTAAGNRLFFVFDDTQAGAELWTSDGSETGTQRVKDINPGTNGSSPTSLTIIGSTLFFAASDATHGNELWRSDGTSTGTTLVIDIVPGSDGANLLQLRNANGVLVFGTAYYPLGLTLWRSNGTEAGTSKLKMFTPKNDDAFSRGEPTLVAINGVLFFVANDIEHGPELWRSDGTNASTALVKDISPQYGADIGNLTVVGDRLFFTANDQVHGEELWTSDGTEAGTQLVKDINGDAYPNTQGSRVRSLVSFKGALYFTADDGVSGSELWRSDGTRAGTVRITDLQAGISGSVYGIAHVGDILLLHADDGIHGTELWRSDGTTAGTTLLKDVVVGQGSSQYSSYMKFIRLGNVFFFSVPTGPDAGLWKTDGTEAGTVLVKTGSANLYYAAASNGLLFYVNGDATIGSELWASDGTTQGTRALKDIWPGSASSYPSLLTDLNGTLLFVASDGTHGPALWRSNGTEAGTQIVADLSNDAATGTITAMTALPEQGIAVFSGFTSARGAEMWQTDGTMQNTRLVVDVAPGPASANPHSFILNNGALYFAADDWTTGMELWRVSTNAFLEQNTESMMYLPFVGR